MKNAAYVQGYRFLFHTGSKDDPPRSSAYIMAMPLRGDVPKR